MKPGFNGIANLEDIAYREMISRGFITDFSEEVKQEVGQIDSPLLWKNHSYRDLRHFLWCSIDNDDSLDLDQLTYAEVISKRETKIYIAIANVASVVQKNSLIDKRASTNTTSVYTPAKVFHMLPEKLSTHLTSLNENEDRLAIVVEVIVHEDGSLGAYDVYPSLVKNVSKLAYSSVGRWLETGTDLPSSVAKIPSLDSQLLLQSVVAQQMKKWRYSHGMLNLQKQESKPLLKHNQVVNLVEVSKNLANELIEYFMIAANNSITKFMRKKQLPLFRRVVRIPKKWSRIVAIAANLNETLPSEPNSEALSTFLTKQKRDNPERFHDLSLIILKLLGRGEYVVQESDETPLPHFGLSLKEYSHTTAPNRRFPDLVTQRILLALFENRNAPYTHAELVHLAERCTAKEADAEKVERKLMKCVAAAYLSSHLNETFEGIITGAAHKGTWVRLFDPSVEGKVIQGFEGLDVGDRVTVQLIHVDVNQGFIDFKKV